jgi:DNA polymerase-3 subunit alpha
MKPVSKQKLGSAPVYDIGVQEHHNFILENGLIASNCFNKSHSISYSVLTYISAYLKANYPAEFFCGLMTVRCQSLQPKDWARKAPEYIQEAKKLDVLINPPSVNGSDLEFTIKDNQIYFGLTAIRDVGKTASRSIIRARGQTAYKDVYDFIQRVNLRKVTTKVFVSLAKAGAFDKLGYSRSELVEKTPSLYDYVRKILEYEQRKLDLVVRNKENEQKTFLIEKKKELLKALKKEKRDPTEEEEAFLEETASIRRKPALKPKEEPAPPEYTRSERVQLTLDDIMEQAHYIGCYIDIHPAQLISKGCSSINSLYTGERATICGVVTSMKVVTTKRGRKMAFIEVDDSTAIGEATIFPKIWNQELANSLDVNKLIRLNVRVEQEEPVKKLIVNSIQLYKE